MLALISLFLTFLVLGFMIEYVSLIGFGGILATIVFIGLLSYRLVFGLALLPFAYAMSPELPLAGIPIRIEDLLIPVIFLFWFLNHMEKGKNLKPSGLYLPLLLMLSIMGISTFNAFVVNPNFDRFRSFMHLIKHVEYLVIFFLAFNIPKDRDDLKLLVHATMAAAIVISLFTAFQPLTTNNFVSTPTTAGVSDQAGQNKEADVAFRSRVSGIPTETANIFGGFLVVHFLMLFAFFLEESNNLKKILYIAGALVIFYPLLFTLSRSSYVGMLTGLSFIGLVASFEMFLLMFTVPFLAPIIFPGKITERFGSIIVALRDASLAPSWQARLEAWIQYFPTILKNPIIGEGLYYVPMGSIDNEYVLRALETGITGLLILFWIIFAWLRRSIHLLSEGTEEFDRKLGLGFSAALIGISVHALAATSFTTIRIAESIYFLSGVMVANYLIVRDVEPEHTHRQLLQKEKKKEKRDVVPRVG